MTQYASGDPAIGAVQWLEAVTVVVCAVVLAVALPLNAGYLAWSWDGLNHHVYLGWMAETGRLDKDVVAASFQSYQYPYLYWPVYRLALMDGPGAHVAMIWCGFQALMIAPPLWWLSWLLVPRSGVPAADVLHRLLACVLGGASTIVLAGFDTTANDLLAAAPLLWAFALMAEPAPPNSRVFGAAFLWGLAAAFKLSNAIFLPVLLVWWWKPEARIPWPPDWRRMAALTCGACAGFGPAYLPWGWQLWQLTGNPFYPWGQAVFGSPAS